MSASSIGARLVAIAVHSWTSVINERAVATGDFPVTISGTLVCVVEEAVIFASFVEYLLWSRVERIIYRTFKGGHFGCGAVDARLVDVGLVGDGVCLIERMMDSGWPRDHTNLESQIVQMRTHWRDRSSRDQREVRSRVSCEVRVQAIVWVWESGIARVGVVNKLSGQVRVRMHRSIY